MLESVEWCSLCQAKPADGTLTILIDNDEPVDIPACEDCVNDKSKVQFV